jgi:hypothetical protein
LTGVADLFLAFETTPPGAVGNPSASGSKRGRKCRFFNEITELTFKLFIKLPILKFESERIIADLLLPDLCFNPLNGFLH